MLFAVLALPLAGCSNVDRAVATSPIPDDYHQRHPVVLSQSPQSLDVFLVGSNGHLDLRQTRDVQVFAEDFLTHGQGRIRVMMPGGPVDSRDAESTLTGVRHVLAATGVKGDLEVGSYKVSTPGLAAVLRISFNKLQAKVASKCGDWPEELGSGSTTSEWENRSYYNMGCASQTTLSAMIDDPRDLVRPRAEDPSDVQMRTRAIQDIRGAPGAAQGTDPSTAWGQTRPITN